jgi:hypothetical protein
VSSPSISTVDLYRLVVDSADDYAIFARDPGRHIVSWNPGFQLTE